MEILINLGIILLMSEYFRKYIKKDHYPLHFSDIKFKTFFNNCVQSTLLARNYRQTQDDDWDIYWCEKHLIVESLDKLRLFPNKRINHFRNFYEICRKDLLSKNIKRHKKTLDKQGKNQQASGYTFLPLTYNLPSQYPIFNEEYKRAKERDRAVWIMKPIGQSQGKGIFLFRSISDIEEWSEMKNQPEAYIVQRYIHNPLLIGHKKFDLRIYVLVTSHNNLTIYLYRAGFARFTHYRYDSSDISAVEGHLTNVAIQKNTDNYDQDRGGKYQLDKLKIYLVSKFGEAAANECFYQVQELVIKTLQATAKLIISDKRCFQLYGFDILIDAALKPWLIEVNGSPSMTANTSVDKVMKLGLLDDVITVVNLEQLMTGEEERIGGFDLIYRNSKRVKPGNKNISMLGCVNDRMRHMRKLAKVVALRQAEKPKKQEETNNNNKRNKSNFTSSRTGPNQNFRSKAVVDTNNLKLPKVLPNTNKMLGTDSGSIHKKTNQIRITHSKESRR